MGSLLFDSRSGRFLIGFLGSSFGYLPNPIFTFPLGCFDAGPAGVSSLVFRNVMSVNRGAKFAEGFLLSTFGFGY